MIETYREENEVNEAMMQLKNNAILAREEILENGEREEMEALMDDASWEEEDILPDGTEDLSYL